MVAVRAIDHDTLGAYVEHLARHARESGRDGDLVFMPFSLDATPGIERWRTRGLAGWDLDLDTPEWRRGWLATDGERVVGHAELTGAELPTGLHRADFGMGLERAYRGRGLGRRLLDTTIAWAAAQDELAWLDLAVFAHNDRARALYRAAGFVELGVRRDLFRVDGQQIDDVWMALDLEAQRARPTGRRAARSR